MDFDTDCKIILNASGIYFNTIADIEGIIFPGEQLLSDLKYEEVKKYIPELKKKFSSSFMTSLQKKAEINQKWPLINLIRQILTVYNYHLTPIRKCDGYNADGVKKFKRYFKIIKKCNTPNFQIFEENESSKKLLPIEEEFDPNI